MKNLPPRIAPSSLALGLMTALAALGTSSSAFADASWIGDSSQDWNNSANWSSDPAAPTGNLTINTAVVGVYPIISSASSITPVDIFLGTGAGNSGRLDQSTGTLSLANTSTNGNWVFVGTSGGTGTYNLTGDGSLAVGKLWVGGQVFGENGTGTVTINTSGSVTANSTDDFSGWGQYPMSVSVGWGPTGNGTLNLQNGTLNANGVGMFVGSWGSTGTVNQTGGTLNTPSLSIAKWFGTGAMNVTNGTVNVSGTVRLAVSGNGGDLMNGSLNVNSGGIVNSGGDLVVAVGGNSASTGTLSIATGGVVNVGTTTERWMIVNQFDTVAATVNVNGGTLNLNANTDLRFSANGGTGASVVNLNSGAITSYSGNGTGSSTSGVVDLNQAGGASANNTFNLNGGTLTTAQVITISDTGTATFNFNGGTLRAANSSATFLDLGGASQTAVVKAGGAIIDSNGFAVTIPQALLAGTGGGGLAKNGTGTLTLSGANTFVGDTTVNTGGLTIASTGSLLFSVTDVDSTKILGSGTFAFDGTMRLNLGAVTVGSGSWQLVDTGSLLASFGGTFAVVDAGGLRTFTKAGNLWTSNDSLWVFSQTNGTLTLGAVPEPSSTAALFGAFTLGTVALRRRRRA